MARTTVLIIIIIILVLLAYAQYYTKFNQGYRILQSNIYNIDEKVLYEKYPIIINERIVSPESLLSTLFKYMYLFKASDYVAGSPMPYANVHKFYIIYSPEDDIDINLVSPVFASMFKPFTSHNNMFMRSYQTSMSITNAEYITIKLKQRQVLILPYAWLYQTNKKHYVITLDDVFSRLVAFYKLSLPRQPVGQPAHLQPHTSLK